MKKTINGFIYTYEKNKLINVLKSVLSKNGNLKVPGSIDGQNISEIKPECFSCLTLDVLDLSELTEIKVWSGEYCTNCDIGELKFPKNLIEISSYATDNFSVKKIQIPESVRMIGRGAFKGSNAEITFPENTKIIFGESACRHNFIPNLIVWPEWDMGDFCFCDCNIKFLEIKEGVEKISEACFASNGLTLLTLPDSVCSIGYNAFTYNLISELNINWGNISFLGSSAFYHNQINGILDLSDLLIVNIPSYCFANNNIKGVILNDYVSSVPVNAFRSEHSSKEIKVKIPPFAKKIY